MTFSKRQHSALLVYIQCNVNNKKIVKNPWNFILELILLFVLKTSFIGYDNGRKIDIIFKIPLLWIRLLVEKFNLC